MELESVVTSDFGVSDQAESPFESAEPENSEVRAEVDGISGQTTEGSIEKTEAACIEDKGGETNESAPRSRDDPYRLEDPPAAERVNLETSAIDETENNPALDKQVFSAPHPDSPAVEPASPKESSTFAEAQKDATLDKQASSDQSSSLRDSTTSVLHGLTAEEPFATVEAEGDVVLDTMISVPERAFSVQDSTPSDLPEPTKEELLVTVETQEDAALDKDAIPAPHPNSLAGDPVGSEEPSVLGEGDSPASDLPGPTEEEPSATVETQKDATLYEEMLSSLHRNSPVQDFTASSLSVTKEEEAVAETANLSQDSPPPESVEQSLESLSEPNEPETLHEQEQSVIGATASVPKHDEELSSPKSVDIEVSTPKDQSTDGEWSGSVTGKKGKRGKKKRRGQLTALPLEETTTENSDLPVTGTEPILEGNEKPELVEHQSETAPEPLHELAAPKPEVADANVNDTMASVAPTPAPEETAVPEIGENPEPPAEGAIPAQAIEAEGSRSLDQQIESTKAEDVSTSEADSRDAPSSEDLGETMPDKRLSKRDKKKKKKRGGLIESAHDGPERSEPMPLAESNDVPSVALESIPEVPEVAQVTSQESSEDWSSTKKSKKDKKRAQRAALAAASPLAASVALGASMEAKEETAEESHRAESPRPPMEPFAEEEQQPVGETHHVQESQPAEEPQPAGEPREPEPVRSWADEVSESVSFVSVEVPRKTPQSVREDGDGGLEVPFENQEDREGSKTDPGAAESNTESMSIVKAEQFPEPAASESQHTRTISGAASNVDAMETKPDLQALEAPTMAEVETPGIPGMVGAQALEAPTTVDAEDEWAPTTKKRGKKNRKGKGSGALTPATESGASSQPESAEFSRQPIEKASPEPAANLLPQPEEPKPTEPEQTSQSFEDNDTWAFTTGKGKSGSGVATPAIEPETLAEPDPVQTVGEIGETGEQTHDPEKATEPLSEREWPNEGLQLPSQTVEVPVYNLSASMTEPAQRGEGEEATDTPGISWRDPETEGPPSAGDVPSSEAKDQPLPTEPPPTEEKSPDLEAEKPSTEPKLTVETENEWPTSKKKRKSKGKKGKGFAAVPTDESISLTQEKTDQAEDSGALILSEAQPEEPAGRGMGKSQLEEPKIASVVEEHIAGDAMDVDAPEDPVDVSKSAEKEPMVLNMDPAPAEASPDSIWEAPAKKKAKRDKRRKSKQPIALTSEPDSSSQRLPAASFPSEAEETSTTKGETRGLPASDDGADSPVSKPEAGVNKESVDSPASALAASPASEAIEISKAFVEQSISEPGQKQIENTSAPSGDTSTDMGASTFDDVREGDHGPSVAGTEFRAALPAKNSTPIKEATLKDETVEGSGPSNTEKVAAAGAITGGVALIAEKFGGSKKKKKGKQKIVDKRQPREEDFFDDPALWEGADKKGLETQQGPSMDENFWGDSEEKAEASNAREAGAPAFVSESLTESEEGWKETARQGAPLDEDFTESPILGRGERGLVKAEPAGLLRRGPEVEEPVGGLLREEREGPAGQGSATPEAMDVQISSSRALPAVQEFPEAEAEAEATRHHWSTPDVNRDSGFGSGSPNPQQRRGKLMWEQQQRDSGVHTGDGAEMMARTPEPGGVVQGGKPRRSPYGTPVVRGGTPVLREPPAAEATPEPEKKRSKKKSYGDLGGVAAATSSSSLALTGSRQAERSASDSHAADSRGQALSERAEAASFGARRTASNTSLARRHTPEPLKFRPESPGSIMSSPAPPLRRMSKRMSGDLRALRRQSSATSSTTHDKETDKYQASGSSSPSPPPVANESRARARGGEMADVYDGFGEGRMGSPRSPTRPHSMRRRQSMQVLELESRVEQLMAENTLLAEARSHAEHKLSQRAAAVLSERDAEIESLKQSLQFLHNEVSRLTEVNDGLASANAELAAKDSGRYADLEVRYATVARELDEARGVHNTFSQTLQEKDAEIAGLRAQLESAKEQMRDMQRKILDSKASSPEFLNFKDEDYFDNRCQQLCSHVQQWVLRFSKFSDMRACRLTSEINDEKTIDRLDNAVLDGSDVDSYLNDRVRRRDIFMSMTMNMIWEFVFTRYLFGMDREQRQKLKSLEKLLIERGNFKEQRELDTEAVVQAIFQTLSKILPPPSNLESQIQSQLRRVMREAVDLSVEMRTQRAEYMMLPPLQPEYDADGELAATVYFDAAMMNERSGNLSMTNEEIEAQGAVVRIVLFPLVVKRGDDDGVGEDKVVVCPAQVLVARDKGKRHFTPSSDAGGASLGAPSRISVVTDHSMAPSEGHYLASDV
ncbi:involucrin repeat protein [Hirsutella rhossiliensis]|uniref:Involucrin repeat protein n=1 Tax=Hirsutella rhossiliensis TaxID=111463 RepID=A0A9P8N7A8_9HYPO|nr:involucrin repeat protein [Hirsutella rhossiliensis]KAH0967286.1 involucrin repeat protein [Hirsutella rhossiliensis]